MQSAKSNENIEKLKSEIAYFMRRLYRQFLTTTSGGNISAITDEKTILITASATDKARIKASEIIAIDLNGNTFSQNKTLQVSIEKWMHIEIYKNRPDVKAIVHAHPLNASALSASSIKIRDNLIAETRAVLGKITYAEYNLMGSVELAKIVAKSALNSDCIVMQNHGIIALGKNLLQAFDRIEVLEAAAKMTILHEGVLKGSTLSLSDEQILELDRMMGRK
ncbi:MAG TPA: class II aldolase/adducin family protein [Victivallales bacterium]|nr:class II aldolase/adducin family protein [Victivallales bacterium]HPO89555.1 class II aldolase/adducin family protein [Victivallales bacterium]HRR06470.1 class II aldolase/adducin family protein [Victivallales bacterium]HRR29125.1 class II aldolase/adducin family protein [Victivallales bacterium]HRU01662.1 class II aldolase/adducin family protein [Victivallales bacterium]